MLVTHWQANYVCTMNAHSASDVCPNISQRDRLRLPHEHMLPAKSILFDIRHTFTCNVTSNLGVNGKLLVPVLVLARAMAGCNMRRQACVGVKRFVFEPHQ